MSKLIVALDHLEINKALNLASLLQGHVWGFKVNDLLLEHGAKIIPWLGVFGNVFADPKLHDIPATMGHSVRVLADAGADFITVHLAAGTAALEAARQNCGKSKLLGVTALTSLTNDDLKVYSHTRGALALQLAHVAQECGIHGLVCSVHELPILEDFSLLKVCPGLRPNGLVADDDQRMIGTYDDFLFADYVVVGRPVTTAPDIVKAAIAINEGLERVP